MKQPEDEDAFTFDIETATGNKTISVINPGTKPVNAIKEELQSFVNSNNDNTTTAVSEIDGLSCNGSGTSDIR